MEPVGIAHGLGLAKSFSDGKKIALILGDNIFGDDLSGAVKKFSKKEKGGLGVLKKVSDPERFIEFLMSSKPSNRLLGANIMNDIGCRYWETVDNSVPHILKGLKFCYNKGIT
ncbi:MAG: hypothetical protein A3J47_01245 [Candidatus Yanofskybacteria bacterium RIFCSPHIGHO2_02_FULL_43_22]|uniref:Glucose-1-phosphate thymidylyltransferase n=1 Tax=Candidatus Yanofskybacteria bacterium RIFCSPHIGHO2_02_FULL_43_22 TaxID=1802681 RepID=A0A1F8FJ08_9BACT|nr:MAG: hypothetical protein A3J47_01245 [Candidatus Yanofskybacteria bacterium RIFCSPHIGHO2_02_FULL_43_22]